jgi:hypothetical protein
MMNKKEETRTDDPTSNAKKSKNEKSVSEKTTQRFPPQHEFI